MDPNDTKTLHDNALRAMQAAADQAVEDAIRTKGSVIVWENGAVRKIPWYELLEERKKLGEKTETGRELESTDESPSP